MSASSSSTSLTTTTSPFSFPVEGYTTRVRRFLVQCIAVIYGLGVLYNAAWLKCSRRRTSSSPSLPIVPPPLPLGFKESFLQANGASFHIVEAPSSTTVRSRSRSRSSNDTKPSPPPPLMLLLHGFPETWRCWRHVMTDLSSSSSPTSSSSSSSSSSFRIVAIDTRGCGDSEANPAWPLTAYSLPTLVEDIRCIILKLGYTEANIVAHDWGALIAWSFAAMYPQMTTKLAILAVPHPKVFEANMTFAQLKKSWYILFFQLPYLPEWYMNFMDGHFVKAVYTGKQLGVQRKTGPRAMTADDVAAAQEKLKNPWVRTAAINYYRNLFGVNRESQFRHITGSSTRKNPLRMPVLHIWGGKDGALGVELTKKTEVYCSQYKLVVIEESSHWLQQDAIEETVGLLRDFFVANQGKKQQ